MRRTYVTLGAVFLLMTATAVAVTYDDAHICRTGLPERWVILSCDGLLLLINLAVLIFSYRFYNQAQIPTFRNLTAVCTFAYVLLALPAIVIDHQYNQINRFQLDRHRPDAYVAMNPDAIEGYRQRLTAGGAPRVGPDLASLLNGPDFEWALRHQVFYKQNFDEPFQIFARSVMFGYRARTRLSSQSQAFVIVRFPAELANALRFQLAPGESD